MAVASSAQAAIIAAAAPARPSVAARRSSSTQSLPSVFKRVEMSEFSGLKSSSGCITYGRQLHLENSLGLFDVLASTVTPKAKSSGAVKGETVAKLRVAINGFGRVGRNFLRSWHGRKHSPLDVVAVNDIVGIQHDVQNAIHLLKYDSVMGTFQADLKKVGERTMSVDGNKILVFSNRDPSQLPWSQLGIDVVIEATGVFVNRHGAERHIHSGAKKVIIAASAQSEDIPTYVMGVNVGNYSHEIHTNVISNGSSSTNCVAPLLKILSDNFGGIEKATVTTIQSYTSDQSLLDTLNCDSRRARAAALNIVPTTTDIGKSLCMVLPDLKLEGKLNGIALRVPTPNVSVVDLVVNVGKRGFSAEDVNRAFRYAADGYLKGIVAVNGERLVSMDFRGSSVSATVDESLTMVMGDNMVKIVAWYDNEWGYSQRVVDVAHMMEDRWPGATHAETGVPIDYEQLCKANPETAECTLHDP